MKTSKTTIPTKIRKEINESPEYEVCMLYGHHGHVCGGRITREHTKAIAGRSCQTKAFIIALCAKGHSVDEYQDNHELNKELNEWIGYSRASENEMLSICNDTPGTDPKLAKSRLHFQRRDYLNKKYGTWEQKYPLHPLTPTSDQGAGVMVPMSQQKKNVPFDRTKGFWKKVEGDINDMIVECAKFHKDVEDMDLNRSEMLDEMVRTYYMNMKQLEEFGTVTPMMLVGQRKLEQVGQ